MEIPVKVALITVVMGVTTKSGNVVTTATATA
jgi:hypothetical protein